MNDLKTISVLQKLYKNSTREGQVSLVSLNMYTLNMETLIFTRYKFTLLDKYMNSTMLPDSVIV